MCVGQLVENIRIWDTDLQKYPWPWKSTLAAPEGGERVAAHVCPLKLSPNAADHRQTTKPTEGAADGHLIFYIDYHLLCIRLGSWRLGEAPLFI